MKVTPRIAVIGYGAMAKSLIERLASQLPPVAVGAALVRGSPGHQTDSSLRVFVRLADLIDWRPDLVVECAGHAAVLDHVPTLLASGIDVVVASVGALGETGFARTLAVAADQGASRLIVPSGAVGGLDALRAARLGGLERVRYVGRKPPLAWTGTPAAEGRDLAALRAEQPIFVGNASDAVRLYPKNANVTAAVALAGVGFERTEVTLIADPTLSRNQHEIEAEGSFGRFRIALENRPLASNPKTSELAALSIGQAVIGHFRTTSF